MIQHLIVPVDGSPDSWRAFDVALLLARRIDCDVRLVEVACDPVDRRTTLDRLDEELQRRGPFDVEVAVDVRMTPEGVAAELAACVALHPGAVVVMSSHGKGRSAAIVGSVTEDLLRRSFGPIILVGPNVEPADFDGPIVVTVDGSTESESALPLAAAWASELGTTPWIVHVADRANDVPPPHADVFDSAYAARLAKDLTATSGQPIEFDELHGRRPDRAVTEYAQRHRASLIIASSHGRSGLSRMAFGSIAAGFVRNASCPVVVVRLPHPVETETREHMWAY